MASSQKKMPKDQLRMPNYCFRAELILKTDGTESAYRQECLIRVFERFGENEAEELKGVRFVTSSLPSQDDKVVVLVDFNANHDGKLDKDKTSLIEGVTYQAILTMYAGKDRRIITDQDWFDIGWFNKTGGRAAKWFAERFHLQLGVHGVAILRRGAEEL